MTAVDTITNRAAQKLEPAFTARQFKILIATDGSGASMAAFRMVNLIRQRIECDVHILSVLEPLPLIVPMSEMMAIPPDIESLRSGEMHALATRQAQTLTDPSYTIEMRVGPAAETIARYARECGASLIIVGAHRHGFVGRVFGEETAMEVARESDVPLLVASSETARLPRRVLAAMDIKPHGLEAMPSLMNSISDADDVTCVHVKPVSEFLGVDWAEFDAEYEIAMQERFAVVEASLRKAGLKSMLVVKHGDVTRELCGYADYFRAELVVIGIDRKRALKRSRGRLASRMLRHVSANVLILPNVPEQRRPALVNPSDSTHVVHNKHEWSAAMKAFTLRNAGRFCTLEIDDAELGALVEVRSYPLLGIDYDHRDERLTITVGELSGTERHLTRSVARPASISIRNQAGRDSALCVTHGTGQTLLTFESPRDHKDEAFDPQSARTYREI